MFKCECGKFFEKSQSYAAHKTHCGKVNDILYQQRKKKLCEARVKAIKAKGKAHKEKLEQWLNEKRICEKCKNEFTLKTCGLKAGTGRFCS